MLRHEQIYLRFDDRNKFMCECGEVLLRKDNYKRHITRKHPEARL